jgi:hypothetical protein
MEAAFLTLTKIYLRVFIWLCEFNFICLDKNIFALFFNMLGEVTYRFRRSRKRLLGFRHLTAVKRFH